MSADAVDDVLERRYRRLLLAYPAAYRVERGEEILATLVELAPPGQRRPAVREAAALLRGGVRARAGVDRLRTRREAVLGGLRLGVIVVLACYALVTGYDVGKWLTAERAGGVLLVVSLVTATAAAGALVAALSGRHGVGAALLLVSFAPVLVPDRPDGVIVESASLVLVAAGLLAVLARSRPPAIPRWHLVLVAAPFPLVLAITTIQPPARVWGPLLLGYLVAAVFAAVVDPRVPITVGTFLLAPLWLSVLAGILVVVEHGAAGGGRMVVIPGLAVLAAAFWAVGTVRAGRQVTL